MSPSESPGKWLFCAAFGRSGMVDTLFEGFRKGRASWLLEAVWSTMGDGLVWPAGRAVGKPLRQSAFAGFKQAFDFPLRASYMLPRPHASSESDSCAGIGTRMEAAFPYRDVL